MEGKERRTTGQEQICKQVTNTKIESEYKESSIWEQAPDNCNNKEMKITMKTGDTDEDPQC